MRDYSVDDGRSKFASGSIDQITVGVCDDEHYVHDLVDKVIMKYAKEKHIEVFIEHFLTAEELLDYCRELDVLLLDIDMPEMDGIEVGHKLRKRNVDYKIIMLTGREDRFREAFEIEVYRFVTKPIDEKKLFTAIDDVRDNNQLNRKVLVFRDGVQYSIPQKEILYVEANRSATLIYTVNAEFRSEQTLAEWSDMLDSKAFFQCHKSFVVNMGKIDAVQDGYILMINRDRVLVSRRLRKAFMNAYMIYDTKWR